MLGGVATCPCKGQRGHTWHHENNVPQCAHSHQSRKEYRERRKHGVKSWIPGTDIDIPEVEEL